MRLILWGLFFATRLAVAAQLQIYTVTGTQKAIATARYSGDINIIQVTGLQPGATYTLNNTYTYNSATYQSSVTMTSDATGTIDTSVTPALSGSYTGTDYDGLFWSMTTSSPTAKFHIVKSTPAPTDTAYQISVAQNGTQVVAATLPFGTTMPGVKSVALTGTGLVGTLYLPKATGPRPAIIAYGGSEGGSEFGVMTAQTLANHGYVALGVAYFGATGVPTALTNIPLEYFQKAIQYLQSRPEVQGTKIGVMGASRGGELSLLLGATFPDIKAVVAMVPSAYSWDGDSTETTPQPSWTYQGKGIPFLVESEDMPVCETLPTGDKVYCSRPTFEQAVAAATPAALEAAASKVELTNGPILLLGSDSDEIWESCPFIDAAMNRLKANNHPFADEEICFPNAGHWGVAIPTGPTTGDTVAYEDSYYFAVGGTAAGDAAAQRATWTKILQFLGTSLGGSGF